MIQRLFLLFIVVALLAPPSKAQSADALLERMRSKYESLTALRASFVQQTTSDFLESDDVFTGMIVLSGDQYRVETPGHMFVSNGETVWVYNEADEQVLINNHEDDETSFSISRFFFEYDDSYRVDNTAREVLNGEVFYQLQLIPTDPESFFSEVRMWLRASDNLVTRLHVSDLNETQMLFELENIEINPALPNDTFAFEAPEGVEVVDLRL